MRQTDATKHYRRADRAIAVICKMLMVAESRLQRLMASDLMRGVYKGAEYAE